LARVDKPCIPCFCCCTFDGEAAKITRVFDQVVVRGAIGPVRRHRVVFKTFFGAVLIEGERDDSCNLFRIVRSRHEDREQRARFHRLRRCVLENEQRGGPRTANPMLARLIGVRSE
jgi:hypothetical protein